MALSNWKPRDDNWEGDPIWRSYPFVPGIIPAPTGGYPIYRILRHLVDDRIDRIGRIMIDPYPVGTRIGYDR